MRRSLAGIVPPAVAATAALGLLAWDSVRVGATPSDTPAPVASTAAPVSVDTLPRVVHVAHRGGALEVRENSLSGLREAVESGTADVIDLDTRLLRDGTLVLHHDATVDRESAGTGSVASYDRVRWAALLLDAGPRRYAAIAPEPAATLEQALDAVGGRVVLSVEAKDPASVDAIATLVAERDLGDSVLVNTNDLSLARRIATLGLRTHLWRSPRQVRDDEPRSYAAYVDVVSVRARTPDDVVRRYVSSGIPRVWANVEASRLLRDRVAELGVSGFVTDAPRYLTGTTDLPPLLATVVEPQGRARAPRGRSGAPGSRSSWPAADDATADHPWVTPPGIGARGS